MDHISKNISSLKELEIEWIQMQKEIKEYNDINGISDDKIYNNVSIPGQKINYHVKFPSDIAKKLIEDGLSKRAIQYFIGLLTEVNTNGEIVDVPLFNIIDIVRVKYGYSLAALSTLYYVHKVLVKKGYISFKDNRLTIVGYKDAYEAGSNGTFNLPLCIFTGSFINLSVAATRLALLWLEQIRTITKHKTIGYPINKQSYAQLHKRCPHEVRTVIEELEFMFDIAEYSEITYKIALKREYLIENIEDIEGKRQPESLLYKSTWNTIVDISNKTGITNLLLEREIKYKDTNSYKEISLIESIAVMTKLLKRYKTNRIKYVLEILKDKLRNYSDPIRSIGAFIQSLIDAHIKNKSDEEKDKSYIERVIEYLAEKGLNLQDVDPQMYQQYIALCKA